MQKQITILGVDVHPLTMEEAVGRACGLVNNARPSLIVTANPEMVIMANYDPLLMEILERADLVVPDGIGLVWASRLLGESLPERIPGIELMQQLLKQAAAEGLSVYFLGGRPGVAAAAAERARSDYPKLDVVGTHHGYFTPQEEDAVLEDIRGAQPDLLFVAMGVPRQEQWAAARLASLQVPAAMGVGGSLDVLAGVSRRAPRWMQQLGLEWLYRFLRQPSRLSRLRFLPQFVLWVLLERILPRGDVS